MPRRNIRSRDRWSPPSLDLVSTSEPSCGVASYFRFTSQLRPSIFSLSSPFHRNPPLFGASLKTTVAAIELPSFTMASFPIAPNGAHDYFLQQQDLNINIPSCLSDFADSPGHIKSFRHLPLLRRQSTRSVQSTCEQ